jgi:hypothetical protein
MSRSARVAGYLAVAVVAAGVASAGTFLATKDRHLRAGTAVRPGDEVFAVDPAAVTELSVATAEWRFIALRWNPKDRFTLISSARAERTVRTCQAGPAFDQVLAALASWKARRALTEEEGRHLRGTLAGPLAQLTLADGSQLEPARWELALGGARTQPLVAFSSDLPSGVELELDRRQVERLAEGCAGLGAGGAPVER